MGRLYLAAAVVCVLSPNAFCSDAIHARCNEIDVDLWRCTNEVRDKRIAERMAELEEIRFQRDSDDWKWDCLYEEDRPLNHYDIQSTVAKLLAMVVDDPVAMGAMEIFLSSFYWRFVDYCVEQLPSMNELNQQRFREILILLAPGLESTRYKARAVNAVGRDQEEVRVTDLRHLPFCLDMFFYAAVRNGQLGRYALAKMCIKAFYAPCLNRGKDKRFRAYAITEATFDGMIFDDWPDIRYRIDSIWPNWK
jgi:hypothetical protein